jgi:GT2 family glycosyltransferase
LTKLSVIIVNFNVKYFLEQCLYSVLNAKKKFVEKYGTDSLEVFVVDNKSEDGSCEFVKKRFPEVQLIENEENVGFSMANNQALRIAKGAYSLLLNPDTIIPEDNLIKVVDFMEDHPETGALGVKMMNGSGEFLPESKRSLPTPMVSFYKIFGLSSLFPKSKKFGRYHLTFLDKDETHEVDVLSGAFMLLRKAALEKTGLLDEDFFMYGEDIDLSYRIKKSGYKNHYFSETEIIHYKGESTKKGSLNYVYVFYNAMVIFAKKHFSKKNAGLYTFFIKTAVWLRAALSVFKRIFNSLFLPLIDSSIFFLGFFTIKPLWERYKFNTENYYPEEYLLYAVPLYIIVWLTAVYVTKGYKRPVESKHLFKGILLGTFAILVIYSLLNESYRYSRALLLLGTAWALIGAWFIRLVFRIIQLNQFSFQKKTKKNILIVANEREREKIIDIILNSEKVENDSVNFYENEGELLTDRIYQIIDRYSINEIVFSHSNCNSKQIIQFIQANSGKLIEFKTYVPGSKSIIGSSSIHSSGDIYIADVKRISKTQNKRIKRAGDIILSILFIAFLPIVLLLIDNKLNVFNNIYLVLSGKKTWVGYIPSPDNRFLPKIKDGILTPVINYPRDSEKIKEINAAYASNFNLTDDIYIIYKAFSKIGNKKL